MRLIDADELLTAFPIDDESLVTKSCIRMTIQHMPTIEPKRGEWIGEADGYADGEFVYDTWYCSNCDYAIDNDEPPAYNFCPNCGARMRCNDC